MRPGAGHFLTTVCALFAVVWAWAVPATPSEALVSPEPDRTAVPPSASPFPIDLEAKFDLVDHTGARRTDRDFRGRPMLIFFGYASCRSVCPTALASLATALELLGPDGADLQPILITVDPRRDTPAALSASLPAYHGRLIGLTGSEDDLAAARASFQVDTREVGGDPFEEPVFAHGSFIYLIGADGRLQALLPPVMAPERIADIIRGHL